MDEIAERLQKGETTVEKLSAEIKSFDYYREAYSWWLSWMGWWEYQIEAEEDEGQGAQGQKSQESQGEVSLNKKKYGLKGYSPIGKSFPYNDYDDFGVARSYGYRREHLGHDMMGQKVLPLLRWNPATFLPWDGTSMGGWRLGISSFDGRRYYYYAHLRQNFPYCKSLEVGSIMHVRGCDRIYGPHRIQRKGKCEQY